MRRSPRIAVAAAGAVLALGLPFVVSGFQTLELSFALIFAIAILGLNVLTGYSGQISLGHAAFLAVGAFVTAIAKQRYGVDYLLQIPITAICCRLSAFLLSRTDL